MQLIYKYMYLCILICCITFCSCKKFLDEKAIKQEFLPSTIEDLQAILDQPAVYSLDPALLEILSDEYYVTSDYLTGYGADLSLNYLWSIEAIPHDLSWNSSYMNPIYFSNVVLDHLVSLKLPADEKYNQIKGSALFYRANAFFNIAQVFAKPFSQSTLSDLGIVLRKTSDINVKSTRATIGETYHTIISDLKEAAELLPISSVAPTRPSKSAAFAALARVYLNMRDYENALNYAELTLKMHNTLLDFNDLVSGVPINSFNPEVIFHSQTSSASILLASDAKIDTVLLASYNYHDLRRSIFFRVNTGAGAGTFGFRGSFNGTQNFESVFSGTTTAEMLLIRAECYARNGNKIKAIADINTLLKKRMDKNQWSEIDPSSVSDAFTLVLSERRKELVYRGLRWMDLRRLNMEGANITLKRVINGIEYTLPPNDNRWVALIPYDVINRSGIQQNPR